MAQKLSKSDEMVTEILMSSGEEPNDSSVQNLFTAGLFPVFNTRAPLKQIEEIENDGVRQKHIIPISANLIVQFNNQNRHDDFKQGINF